MICSLFFKNRIVKADSQLDELLDWYQNANREKDIFVLSDTIEINRNISFTREDTPLYHSNGRLLFEIQSHFHAGEGEIE